MPGLGAARESVLEQAARILSLASGDDEAEDIAASLLSAANQIPA